jgi:hypothetical protein
MDFVGDIDVLIALLKLDILDRGSSKQIWNLVLS